MSERLVRVLERIAYQIGYRRGRAARRIDDWKMAASCCTACAEGFGTPLREWLPGLFMGLVHRAHMVEFLAMGWDTIENDDGSLDDVCCPHFPALYNEMMTNEGT